MRLVIADTGPINYLILIGKLDILPVLFGEVTVPSSVYAELTHPDAPPEVRRWTLAPPFWLEIQPVSSATTALFATEGLDAGETAAIALAVGFGADLVLMDDRRGVAAARGLGLRVTGTLGVLDLAASRGLINFSDAISLLRRTNFHIPEAVVSELQKTHDLSEGFT